MGRKKGKGKGKAARNARANQTGDSKEEDYSKAAHSFVFHRGHVGKTVRELVMDVRKIMEPYTASSLKVRNKNVMKDFLTIAGPMHVTHFIVFTKTDIATYMHLICVPRGPTLTFKVNEFCLARDVLSFQKHPDVEAKLFSNHAVMVTNIPSDTMENKLMNVTFKNMFPFINPNTVKLNNMRRTVLINYDAETRTIDIRHYTMKVVPTGISRAIKKLMRPKLPNLGHHEDIADHFFEKGLSDSEGEQDTPQSQVTVTQKVKDRGVAKNATNAIRLKEIGPRLSLQLIKIVEGFEGGNVLFHALVQKTPEELEALKAMKEIKRKEKMARKQKQEANVKRKKEAKEDQVKKTREGMTRKKMAAAEETGQGDDVEVNAEDSPSAGGHTESDDDDKEYYKQEVGEDPEPEMFPQTQKRKRVPQKGEQQVKAKRFRPDKKSEIGSNKRPVQKNKKETKFSVKFSKKNRLSDGKKNIHNKVNKPKFRPQNKKKRK